MSIRPKLSSIVSSQLPEFIQADYPTFIAFIEAYYEYLENEVNTEYKSLRDLDDTLDSFIQYFKSELGQFLPSIVAVDERFLLENIKSLYEAKGTEASFKLLFRLLSNEEIQLKYPKDYIFRTSNAKWTQDVTFVVTVSEGDVYDLVGKVVSIHTNSFTLETSVNRVRPIADGFEVFVDNKNYSAVEVGDIITYGDVSVTIIESISKVTVYKSGLGFYVGQVFNIPSVSGHEASIKVTNVGDNGELLGIDIIDFGYGYDFNFYATIVSEVQTVSLPTFPTVSSQTLGFIDSGFISSIPYVVIEYGDPSYCGEILQEFYTDSTIEEGTTIDEENTAIINIQIGGCRKYTGYYSDSDGFLSDAYRLQDSYYYQIYSYVITCLESIDRYKDIVKTLVHPTGMKLFGEQKLTNEISLDITLDILDRFIQQANQETIQALDTKVFAMGKPVTDTLTATHTQVYTLQKPKADSVTSSDSYSTLYSKYVDEAITASEEQIISFNKYISDTASILGYLYWESDYGPSDYVSTEYPPNISYAGSTYTILLNN